jgi:response regulator RpfG family c-di-GMP phosphodiesterase
LSSPRPLLLIVDDESRILTALVRALRREPYDVVTAETPAEALRVLDERRVDLIVSDHKMPGMNGVELLGRAAVQSPATVRILITGWTEEVPAAELAEIGVRALLPKPWDDAELKATLRSALGLPIGSTA